MTEYLCPNASNLTISQKQISLKSEIVCYPSHVILQDPDHYKKFQKKKSPLKSTLLCGIILNKMKEIFINIEMNHKMSTIF